MTKNPKIPMRPEDVPQQRIHLVASLPQRPLSFRGFCDYVTPIPEKFRPKGSPRKTEYLGSVEWSWGFMQSRFDSYYLNPRGSYWLLWIRYQDDNDWNYSWEWSLYAYAKKRGVGEREAAIYLLMDAWETERQASSLDHYFLIDDTGLLSVNDISAIARVVWPDCPQED